MRRPGSKKLRFRVVPFSTCPSAQVRKADFFKKIGQQSYALRAPKSPASRRSAGPKVLYLFKIIKNVCLYYLSLKL